MSTERPKTNTYTAALVQFHWRATPRENLEHVLETVEAIGRRGNVRLVALPEFFLGPPFYFPGCAHLRGTVDDTVPGRVTDLLSDLARRYSLYILAGTIVEREGDSYFNCSPVIDDRGEVIGKARKVHCYAAELMAIQPSAEQLIVDTPLGRIGVCVCSDFWIQEMPRLLALRGAEIIYVSGASLSQELGITRPCVQANSVHNVCCTLYTSVVGGVTGERAGRAFAIEFGGYTCAADPSHLLGTLDDQEAVLYVEIDLERVRQLRQVDVTFKNTLYWGLWGRRPELYDGLTRPYVGADTELRSVLEAYLM
jgi:predicted amidohydrolase